MCNEQKLNLLRKRFYFMTQLLLILNLIVPMPTVECRHIKNNPTFYRCHTFSVSFNVVKLASGLRNGIGLLQSLNGIHHSHQVNLSYKRTAVLKNHHGFAYAFKHL